MATIFWKAATPAGTCRSRYKARRAEAVAARQREKRLLRRIGYLLGQGEEVTLSQKMRGSFAAGRRCPQCDLPATAHSPACSFCFPAVQSGKDS